MPRRAMVLVGLLLLALTPAARAGDDLAKKIEALINGPDYRQAHWGILAVDSQTGQVVYEHNPDKLFLPASTTKLYSCGAALAAFGPDYKFETPVYARGPIKDGVLQGDLILVAKGDLTMGGRTDAQGRMAFKDHDHTYAGPGSTAELTDTDPLAGLKALAGQIAAAGIHRVAGDVLVDDRYFNRSRGSGSGPDLLSAIVINDNVVDVEVTPAAEAGQPAAVRMRPGTNYIQTDVQVETVAGRTTRLELHPTGPRSFSVRGQVPAKGKPHVRIYAVDNPAEFARALFIETLRRQGVQVDASPYAPLNPVLPDSGAIEKLNRVASFTSPPLSELVKVTLKVSHNLYASTLPLLLAARNGKRTLAEGLQLERKFLVDTGVDAATISFGGGAGGNNADAVTPRATVQLLLGLAKRPEYRALESGLPVLGVDGTLVDVVTKESPARGKVLAKTGTLSWHDALNNRSLLTSKALAGTMTTARGRPLTLAMFVHLVPLPRGVAAAREGKALGKLCEIFYENAP